MLSGEKALGTYLFRGQFNILPSNVQREQDFAGQKNSFCTVLQYSIVLYTSGCNISATAFSLFITGFRGF